MRVMVRVMVRIMVRLNCGSGRAPRHAALTALARRAAFAALSALTTRAALSAPTTLARGARADRLIVTCNDLGGGDGHAASTLHTERE